MLRSPSRMKFHFENRIPCLCSPSTFLLVGILLLGAVSRFSTITQPFTDFFSWRQTLNAMMAGNFYHGSWNIFYPKVNWSGPDPGYSGFEFQTVSYIAALLYVITGEHEWSDGAWLRCLVCGASLLFINLFGGFGMKNVRS